MNGKIPKEGVESYGAQTLPKRKSKSPISPIALEPLNKRKSVMTITKRTATNPHSVNIERILFSRMMFMKSSLNA
jgi:hypothetical protein